MLGWHGESQLSEREVHVRCYLRYSTSVMNIPNVWQARLRAGWMKLQRNISGNFLLTSKGLTATRPDCGNQWPKKLTIVSGE